MSNALKKVEQEQQQITLEINEPFNHDEIDKILFLLRFLKENFHQFNKQRSPHSLFRKWFNFFTGIQVEIDQIADLLEFIPRNVEQIQLEKLERLFWTISELLNNVLENNENLFYPHQFNLLKEWQQKADELNERYSIAFEY